MSTASGQFRGRFSGVSIGCGITWLFIWCSHQLEFVSFFDLFDSNWNAPLPPAPVVLLSLFGWIAGMVAVFRDEPSSAAAPAAIVNMIGFVFFVVTYFFSVPIM